MKLSTEEIRKEPLKRERLAYNSETGNRIDVEVYLSPLRAMYKVGKEGEETANLFDNLDAAVGKFNLLEEENLWNQTENVYGYITMESVKAAHIIRKITK